jgi:sarcosine oxidase subunit gamma
MSTNDQTILVTDQMAVTAKPETALHHAMLSKLAEHNVENAGLKLGEQPLTELLTLRARVPATALAAAVKAELNLALPDTLQSDSNDQGCVRWIAPDEWLLSCAGQSAFDIEQSLRKHLGGTQYAIVNVSGGFTVLQISGDAVSDVLKKSTAYDVHPSHFPIGKVVNTVLGKAQVTLRCVAENQYELIVRRSFADYIWLWLQTAAKEYGLDIVEIK